MNKKYLILFFLALIISGGFSLLASSLPDGLERVAGDQGFIARALDYPFAVLMPDYSVSLTNNPYLATALAGVFGTIVVFISLYLISRFLLIKIK